MRGRSSARARGAESACRVGARVAAEVLRGRVKDGGAPASRLKKRHVQRETRLPTKSYGNCLLGFHCSQKHCAGNRVFAGFLWRCTSPTWNFVHKLCTGLGASIVDKLEPRRSSVEQRVNP